MMGMENQYNTQLSPEEEQAFLTWATQNNRLRDLHDYDMKGWWKENAGQSTEGHMTDKFKKPNHPTFSNESIYHGVDGNQGGSWGGDEQKGFTFTPGRTNLDMYSPLMLQKYFEQTEPGTKLILPEGQ